MDPNAALADARKASVAFTEASGRLGELMGMDGEVAAREDALDAAEKLRDAFEALDGWLGKGGFLPVDWTHYARVSPPSPGVRLPDWA